MPCENLQGFCGVCEHALGLAVKMRLLALLILAVSPIVLGHDCWDFALRGWDVRDADGVCVLSMGTGRTTMIVAGEHANEAIGTRIVIEWLVTRHERLVASNRQFVVIPRLNECAYQRYVASGVDPCRRLSCSGVDLNRNYPHAWVSGRYAGLRALGTSETRLVYSHLASLQPEMYLSVHSGEEAVYIPPDSQTRLGEWSCSRHERNVLSRRLGMPVGTAGLVSGYTASGTGADTARYVFNVPCVFTLELYGNTSDDANCVDAYNPRDLTHIARVWLERFDALVGL